MQVHRSYYCMQYVSKFKYLLFTGLKKLFRYNNYTYLQRTKADARFISKSDENREKSKISFLVEVIYPSSSVLYKIRICIAKIVLTVF